MEKIINKQDISTVSRAEESTSLPVIEGDGKYQAVIVHADKFDTVADECDLSTLIEKLMANRLIEARFFNDKEEHRIVRTIKDGEITFLYRHIEDNTENGESTYKSFIDTTADYYKDGGYKLELRNYIKKRGILNSYDDMRFVELEKIYDERR